jgi:hypothetical protein
LCLCVSLCVCLCFVALRVCVCACACVPGSVAFSDHLVCRMNEHDSLMRALRKHGSSSSEKCVWAVGAVALTCLCVCLCALACVCLCLWTEP